MKEDSSFILEAVENKFPLQYVPGVNMLNDKMIVSEGVKNDGRSLQYASEQCRNNPDIVLLAIEKVCFRSSFTFASNELNYIESIKSSGLYIRISFSRISK